MGPQPNWQRQGQPGSHPASRARFAERPRGQSFFGRAAHAVGGALADAARFPVDAAMQMGGHPLGATAAQSAEASPLVGRQVRVGKQAVASQLPPNSPAGLMAFMALGGLDALGAAAGASGAGVARRAGRVASENGYRTLGQALVRGERGELSLPNPFDAQIIPKEYPMTGGVGKISRLASSKFMQPSAPFEPKGLMAQYYATVHGKEGSVGSISLGFSKKHTDIGMVRAWEGAPASTYADLTRIPRERFFRKGIPINTMPVNPLVIYSVLKNEAEHPGMFTKDTIEAALWQAEEALNMGMLKTGDPRKQARLKEAIRKMAQHPAFDGRHPLG